MQENLCLLFIAEKALCNVTLLNIFFVDQFLHDYFFMLQLLFEAKLFHGLFVGSQRENLASKKTPNFCGLRHYTIFSLQQSIVKRPIHLYSVGCCT